MKLIFAATVLLLSGQAYAATPAKDKCEAAAWQAANKFFDAYYEEFKADAVKELEPGEKLNEDALPGGLNIVEEIDGLFMFGYGEREECACGFNVQTKMNAKKTWCTATVDTSSNSCECG